VEAARIFSWIVASGSPADTIEFSATSTLSTSPPLTAWIVTACRWSVSGAMTMMSFDAKNE
jgi:hypothetical protein